MGDAVAIATSGSWVPAAGLGSLLPIPRLGAADWAVICVHLGFTMFVGFHVSSKQQTTAKDVMLGGRSMGGFTIALSLLSGLTSGISYLGFPGYMLEDGVGELFSFLCYLVVIPIGAFILIPFFHSLGLSTAYTFFELRFSGTVRTIAAMLFIVRVSLYLAVVLFVPALLLHTVLGFPTAPTILGTGVLAMLWTMKGGMFAVIYTDAIQSVAMVIGVGVTIIVTLVKLGGLSSVYDLLRDHQWDHHGGIRNVSEASQGWMQLATLAKLEPTRSSAPAESYWSLLVGLGMLSTAQAATDQLAVQRFLTARDLQQCVRAFVYSGVFNAVWNIFMALEGLLILAYFASIDCDPIAPPVGTQLRPDTGCSHTRLLPPHAADQVLPYFALTEGPPAMAGLLVAAVLGSTMSVYSGGLNAAATSLHVDILTAALGYRAADDASEVKRLKMLTACFGVLTIALSFAASAFDGVVVLSNIVLGVCAGPLLGLFLLGTLVRRANNRGALIGAAVGVSTMLYYGAHSLICPAAVGDSTGNHKAICRSAAMDWYALKLVSWWSGVLGTGITFFVGVLASLCFPPPTADKLFHKGIPLTMFGSRTAVGTSSERKSLLNHAGTLN